MMTAAQQNAMNPEGELSTSEIKSIVAKNTELWQGIGYIADDETLMRRLSRYVKRLAKEKADDPTLMTKEEFFARVDEARREYDEGKYHTFDSIEDLDRYIRSL